MRAIFAGALVSSDTVERLYGGGLPEVPGRPYQWPGRATIDVATISRC